MRLIKGKYVLLALAVCGVAMIPLSAWLGYMGSWVVFGALALAAGVFLVAQNGLRLNDWFQVQKETADEYEIMGIHGISPENRAAVELKENMRRALSAGSRSDATPVACACVREEEEGFVGVVRLGVPGSHAFHHVTGSSQENAVQRLNAWLNENQKDWTKMKDDVAETHECNHHVCPLASPAKAFAGTPVA